MGIGQKITEKVKEKAVATAESIKTEMARRKELKTEEKTVEQVAYRKARLQAIGKRAELEAKEKVYSGGFMRRAIVPASTGRTGKRKGHAERVRLAERTGAGGRIGFSNPFIPQSEPMRRPMERRPQHPPSMDVGIDFARVHGSLLPSQSRGKGKKRGGEFRWF